MVYEELANSIRKLENGNKASVGDLAGLEMFENWPKSSFDDKIKMYVACGETKKAENIRVIRDFCISEKKVQKKS